MSKRARSCSPNHTDDFFANYAADTEAHTQTMVFAKLRYSATQLQHGTQVLTRMFMHSSVSESRRMCRTCPKDAGNSTTAESA